MSGGHRIPARENGNTGARETGIQLTSPDADFQLFVIQILNVVAQHFVENIGDYRFEHHAVAAVDVGVDVVVCSKLRLIHNGAQSSCSQPKKRLLIDFSLYLLLLTVSVSASCLCVCVCVRAYSIVHSSPCMNLAYV